MATITDNIPTLISKPKRAIEFKEGDLLVDESGRVGLRTERHIVRITVDSLYVLNLEDSLDWFTLAPSGSSIEITN